MVKVKLMGNFPPYRKDDLTTDYVKGRELKVKN